MNLSSESIMPCELVFEPFERQSGIFKIREKNLREAADEYSSCDNDENSFDEDSNTQMIQPRYSPKPNPKHKVSQKSSLDCKNSEILNKEIASPSTSQIQRINSINHENISSLIRLIFNFIIVIK